MDAFESSLASSTITITLDVDNSDDRIRSKDDDIVSVRCTGACSALINLQEAAQASVNGNAEQGGRVRVRDEELIAVCIYRARKRCAEVSIANGKK